MLYTDGVFEAPNSAREQFELQRLGDYFAQHARKDAHSFADDLIQSIVNWSGGDANIDDDVAIIVMDVE